MTTTTKSTKPLPRKIKNVVTLAPNPIITIPKTVALLGLVTLVEYVDPSGKSQAKKWQGHNGKNVNSAAFLLSESTGKNIFVATKTHVNSLAIVHERDPVSRSGSARILKTWASYKPGTAISLEINDTTCSKFGGDVIAIEYESQKWSGKKWSLYRHDFDHQTDLLISKTGSLWAIASHNRRKIVTSRGLIG